MSGFIMRTSADAGEFSHKAVLKMNNKVNPLLIFQKEYIMDSNIKAKVDQFSD